MYHIGHTLGPLRHHCQLQFCCPSHLYRRFQNSQQEVVLLLEMACCIHRILLWLFETRRSSFPRNNRSRWEEVESLILSSTHRISIQTSAYRNPIVWTNNICDWTWIGKDGICFWIRDGISLIVDLSRQAMSFFSLTDQRECTHIVWHTSSDTLTFLCTSFGIIWEMCWLGQVWVQKRIIIRSLLILVDRSILSGSTCIGSRIGTFPKIGPVDKGVVR